MDYIVIGLLIVLTSLVSAVLYACCVMSGKSINWQNKGM